MGAKTCMLVIANTDVKTVLASYPPLDREASTKALGTYFAGQSFAPLQDGDLSNTNPAGGEVYVGCFPGVTVLASAEFGVDTPSSLDPRFLKAAGSSTVYLHAMHSVVDFFAYAVWRNGALLRSLSLAPDAGIIENLGKAAAFELPYWAGEHSADDPEEQNDPDYEPYPFPFHPLELGEAALREYFGYQLEGYVDASLTREYEIPLLHFARK